MTALVQQKSLTEEQRLPLALALRRPPTLEELASVGPMLWQELKTSLRVDTQMMTISS